MKRMFSTLIFPLAAFGVAATAPTRADPISYSNIAVVGTEEQAGERIFGFEWSRESGLRACSDGRALLHGHWSQAYICQ